MLPPDEEIEEEPHAKNHRRVEGGSRLLPVRTLQSTVKSGSMVASCSSGGERGREGGREGEREGGREEWCS